MIPRMSAALAVSLVVCCSRAQAQPDQPAPPYRAVLRGGGAHASNDADTLSLVAQLDVETVHAAIGAGWDAAMGFQFGRQPLFVMTRTPGGSAPAAAHAGGYALTETMRFARGFRFTETAIVGRVGATRVDGDTPLASNDVAHWAWVADARVDLRWYDRDVRLAHIPARPIDPIVSAWLGIRHDQRLHRAGDLGGFDDPTGRIFCGLTVNPVRLPARGMTVGGGFEFERALRGAVRLPSGTRVAVTASVDLRRPRKTS